MGRNEVLYNGSYLISAKVNINELLPMLKTESNIHIFIGALTAVINHIMDNDKFLHDNFPMELIQNKNHDKFEIRGFISGSDTIDVWWNMLKPNKNLNEPNGDKVIHFTKQDVNSSIITILNVAIINIRNIITGAYTDDCAPLSGLKSSVSEEDFLNALNYIFNDSERYSGSIMKEISINAKAFVIPNAAWKMSDFNDDRRQQYFKTLYELNNIEFDVNDKIIQLWLTNKEELGSENLSDHGFRIKMFGVTQHIWPTDICRIPYKLIKDCKENDVINFKFPYVETNSKDINEMNLILNVTMTCTQKGFRYERFGNFEDVVKRVISY